MRFSRSLNQHRDRATAIGYRRRPEVHLLLGALLITLSLGASPVGGAGSRLNSTLDRVAGDLATKSERGQGTRTAGAVTVGYQISGSLGQPAVGRQSSGPDQLHSGIWPQIPLNGTVVGVDDQPPSGLANLLLGQNYPNPFRQSTRIPFSLPLRQHVSMQVFDINGREIAVLVDEELEPGQYEVRVTAGDLAPGVYFYRFQTGTDTRVRKLLLLK